MPDSPDDLVPAPPPDHDDAEGGAGVPSAAGQGADAPEAQSSALDASASPAGVVSLADARKRKASGSSSPAAPPPPGEGVPPTEGKGGGGGKREKTTDWGHFYELIADFALIYGTDTVWDGKNRLIMKISNMAHAHGSDLVKMWKANSARRTVMPVDVVFDPTETCDASRCVNLFGGFALQPAEGEVSPFLELARFLTSRAGETADESDAIMHWLLCWLAYPLQHPGAKLRTAVIMHGDEGAGKNFLFDTVLEIYGEYGALVGQDELEDKFNDWRSGKCMVVGDEVASRQELVHQKNRLKALITSPTVQINPKNLPRREEKNHINIVFLSNELKPLALDNSDRRYLVVYTPRQRERSFYVKLKAWKEEEGGLAALYHYLLAYPLEDFDPYAPAPITRAKMDLIDLNLKSPERFWIEWASGELDLPYRVCAVDQAYKAYCKYAQRIGDRWPVQRNEFTRLLCRISEARAETLDPPVHPARVDVQRVDPIVNNGKTSIRLLLVLPYPDDVERGERKKGEWATEAIKAFWTDLHKYIGFSPPSRDGKPEESGGGEP